MGEVVLKTRRDGEGLMGDHDICDEATKPDSTEGGISKMLWGRSQRHATLGPTLLRSGDLSYPNRSLDLVLGVGV